MTQYIFAFFLFFSSILATLLVIEHPYTYNLKRTTNIFSDKEVLYEIKNVKDITTSDHIVGPDIEKASFVLIEYSDYTCLFCAAMRNTLKEIVDEYNATLVYRHFFPLANLNGIRRAVSAECVSEVAGEDAFWKYTGFLYTTRPTDDKTIEKSLYKFGVNLQEYKECIKNPNQKISQIQKDTKDTQKLGARGTPFILIVKNNKIVGYTYATRKENFIDVVTSSIKD